MRRDNVDKPCTGKKVPAQFEAGCRFPLRHNHDLLALGAVSPSSIDVKPGYRKRNVAVA